MSQKWQQVTQLVPLLNTFVTFSEYLQEFSSWDPLWKQAPGPTETRLALLEAVYQMYGTQMELPSTQDLKKLNLNYGGKGVELFDVNM